MRIDFHYLLWYDECQVVVSALVESSALVGRRILVHSFIVEISVLFSVGSALSCTNERCQSFFPFRISELRILLHESFHVSF